MSALPFNNNTHMSIKPMENDRRYETPQWNIFIAYCNDGNYVVTITIQ